MAKIAREKVKKDWHWQQDDDSLDLVEVAVIQQWMDEKREAEGGR